MKKEREEHDAEMKRERDRHQNEDESMDTFGFRQPAFPVNSIIPPASYATIGKIGRAVDEVILYLFCFKKLGTGQYQGSEKRIFPVWGPPCMTKNVTVTLLLIERRILQKY